MLFVALDLSAPWKCATRPPCLPSAFQRPGGLGSLIKSDTRVHLVVRCKSFFIERSYIASMVPLVVQKRLQLWSELKQSQAVTLRSHSPTTPTCSQTKFPHRLSQVL